MAPAADAIDPGLLAEIEQEMELYLPCISPISPLYLLLDLGEEPTPTPKPTPAPKQDMELDLVEEEMDLRQSDFEARRQQEIRIHKGWG